MADRFGGVLDEQDRFGGIRETEPASPESRPVSQFLSGFNETLGGALADIPNRASARMDEIERLNVERGRDARPFGIPRIPDPIGLLGNLILDKTVGEDPQTGVDRIARRAGQEVAATAPLAAGVFGAAATAPAVTSSMLGQRSFGRGVETLLQGVRNTPLTAAAGEAAATIGAGVGAGVAREIAPDSANAELAGQFVGGMSPALLAQTPTAIAIRLGRGLTSRMSGSAVTRAAEQEVARVVGPELGPRAEAGIDAAEALRQEMPGFSASLAESTQSPALLATQRAIEGSATGQELQALAARREGNVEAITRFAASRAPDAPNSPSFVVDTANRRVQDIRADLDAQGAQNLGQRQTLAETLPTADRSNLGATLRDRLTTIRRDTSARMTQLADELGINNSDVTVQFNEVRQQIVDDFSPGSVFEDARNFPEVVSVLRNLPEDEIITFADLKALRERLTDDLLDAQSAASPSRKRIRVLSHLQERIDGTINDLTQVADPNLAARYDQFRQTYFNEYIEPFERGAAFAVRQRDGRGFYRLPDEKVASAFFGARDVSGARQFKLAFGNDPDATAAITSAAMDNLRDATVRDGVIDPRRFENWLRAHDSVLNEFPEIKAGVSDIRSANQALSARQAQLDVRTKTVNDSILGRRLQAVSRGTQTPEQLIASAVKDPRLMRSLVASLRNDPASLESLRRHVWDDANSLSARDISAFLENNAASLSRAFDLRHLSDLQNIQRARTLVESVPAPQGQAFRPDPVGALTRQLGQGVPAIQARVFAAESGRTSFRFVAGDMFARFIRGRSQIRSDALLREALYNPEVARDLSSMIGFQGTKPEIANRLNVWLFNLGLNEEDR